MLPNVWRTCLSYSGVVKTLEGHVHRKDSNWLAQKRSEYMDRINMDKDKRITVDEFEGFVLAVISDVMSKDGSKKMPDGIRSLIDLNMKHIGRVTHVALYASLALHTFNADWHALSGHCCAQSGQGRPSGQIEQPLVAVRWGRRAISVCHGATTA